MIYLNVKKYIRLFKPRASSQNWILKAFFFKLLAVIDGSSVALLGRLVVYVVLPVELAQRLGWRRNLKQSLYQLNPFLQAERRPCLEERAFTNGPTQLLGEDAGQHGLRSTHLERHALLQRQHILRHPRASLGYQTSPNLRTRSFWKEKFTWFHGVTLCIALTADRLF